MALHFTTNYQFIIVILLHHVWTTSSQSRTVFAVSAVVGVVLFIAGNDNKYVAVRHRYDNNSSHKSDAMVSIFFRLALDYT